MSDRIIKHKVERAFDLLDKSGDSYTNSGLAERLTNADQRMSDATYDVFYDAYLYEVKKGWGRRSTLKELFGRGNVPEAYQNRTLGTFYAVDESHNRRATRHMNPDELGFVAEKLIRRARANEEEAITIRIAQGIVEKRVYVLPKETRDRFERAA